LSASFRTAQQTEAEFAKAVVDQEKRALDLNQKAIEYNVLAREMESNKAMYESVLTRLKEMDVTKELEQTPLRIVEPAYAYGPVRPDKRKILTSGILGGLLLGLGVAIGLSMLDTSVKTVDEAEQLLGLPVLAAIPKWKGEHTGDDTSANLPIVSDPHGAIAESFRSLRSALSLLGREEKRRTFLFTSAVPSEGKSFTASNYAITCAQLGLTTLLIDADLRRPSLSNLFFNAAKKPGLSDCLAGQAQLEEAIVDSNIDKLRLLTAGSTAPNPAELLASNEFAQIVQQALLTYDRVIIDTAPINAVSDTLILAPHVQSICMVVRAGTTPRAAVLRAVKMLTDIQCKPVGTILNRLPQRHGAGYYYYYYAGEYGSEGVYGSKAKAG
jgi:capsular exopolysaccharide synthesis family protein